jgi:hypothetical protein
MKKIKLDSGITMEVADNAIDDMELFEMLISIDEGNGTAVPKALEKLIGKAQKEKLYDSLRKEDGIVRITDVQKAFMAFLEKLGDKGKNS